MRRDVHIQNDSGGFSIITGSAVDDIIADARTDDMQFVRTHRAMLLELVGDDALPVRIVVDEPLRVDEQREWLARVRGQLRADDGRVLVMGGFDPDILEDWRDEHSDADEDGTGVGMVRVAPGDYDVAIYTYASSLNGNALLQSGPLPIGAWFRRDHPGTPFPLWLAHILDLGGDDPGHDDEWRDTAAAFRSGALAIDLDTRGFVGLLFHLQRRTDNRAAVEVPASGWFGPDDGVRIVEQCPRGIAAAVDDPNLLWLVERVTGTRLREPAGDIVGGPRFDVRQQWGAAPETLSGGPVAIGLSRTWLAWAIPALCSDSAPRMEVRVMHARDWSTAPPAPLCVEHAADEHIVGAPANLGGWPLWSAMAELAAALAGIPDGARLELLTGLEQVDDDISGVGMLHLSGKVHGGRWLIDAASPPTTAAHLSDALDFTTSLLEHDRLLTHTDSERAALQIAFAEWGDFIDEDRVARDGDVCLFRGASLRDRVLLAQPVFRTRFAGWWVMDGTDDEDFG